MRVAIYARKSTDQHHVSEAQKSVTRQVDQARAVRRPEGLDRGRGARVYRRRHQRRGVRDPTGVPPAHERAEAPS